MEKKLESTPPLHDGRPQMEGGLDAPIDSPAIRRLLDEVRAEEVDVPRSYNRTFNRHNR